MATQPAWMADAVPVGQPDWMKDAVPVSTPATPNAAPPVDETTGIMGKVGDAFVGTYQFLESLDPRNSVRENAASGLFARDATADEGFLDRAGSSLERGAANVDRGLYNFLGGLGSKKARDAATQLQAGTTSKPIAGATEWKGVDGIKSFGKFVLEQGIESAPAMGVVAIPYAGIPLTAASQTGNIAADRAANDGTGPVTGENLWDAAPWAIGSAVLDKIGLKGITNPAGKTVVGKVAGAATREGLTEATQSGLEYTGGSLGTKAGFDPAVAVDQMIQGGATGFGMGGAMRGGAEVLPSVGRKGSAPAPQSGRDWSGSLDEMMQGDQPPLALPKPDWMADAVPVDAKKPPKKPTAPSPAVDPIADFMQRARGAESGGDDGAKNPKSSATGRYQFIDSTWLATYRAENPGSRETDAQILAKRGDGNLQDRLMRRLTEDNAAALRSAGVPITTGNLYLAHFAGPQGAVALHRDPSASVETVLGTRVVSANPFLKGMSAADVVAWAGKKMGSAGGIIETSAPDIPDVTIPGADGSLLGRGERQERIVKIEIPETSQGQVEKPTPIELPELGDAPEGRRGAASQVTAPQIGNVDTQFELRDLSELIDSSSPNYNKALQPRDRAGRATSGAQIASIAANLDPAQLGPSRLASTGAPIIGPDGQVESGNGRIAALAQAYATQPERSAAYRKMIADMGLDATGLERPVLVRRRTTIMTPEQRQAWTRAANARDTMAMSSTEQAKADADSLDDVVLGMYRGGAVTAAANRDFVRAFINKAVAPAERNAMTAADGSISADGVRRIRFALLSRAYGDTELISRVSEDTDTNIAAIGKALLDAAPAMARLKANVSRGDVPKQYDISAAIAEAAQMISRSRETGQSLKGMLAQTDAFAPAISEETRSALNLFYKDDELRKPRSGEKLAGALLDYANKAEAAAENAKQGNDMFGNAPSTPKPAELLAQIRAALDGDTSTQGDLLARPDSATTAPDDRPSPPDARPAGDQPDGGSRRTVLARGQLRALGIAQELRTEKAAALVGRNAGTPRELAEIAQVYRDPRYETFRIFLTKGDTIVHATGVSSRSVSEAPLMPKGMNTSAFISDMKATMKATGADGYYLLHNHPGGDPKPSRADMDVTRGIKRNIPGFRAHVVINSNKYAEIVPNEKDVNVATVHKLGDAEDKLIAASVPHDVLGRPLTRSGELVTLAKELQKPGWITVIGTSSRGVVRVVVDYPVSETRRDAKALMAMARRVQRQSGSDSLFLIGDRSALDTPTVRRALSGGIVTAAVDMDGNPIQGTKPDKKNKMPEPPARKVAQAVYHGTPHDWEGGKASLAKIGTGEGAQAYGWGLYFAGRKEIAEHYRDVLTANQKKNQARVDAWARYDDAVARFERAEKIERTPFQQSEWDQFEKKQNQDFLAELKAKAEYYGSRPTDGRLYTVDIPEDNEFLLWDKPLSEQPEKVRAALLNVYDDADPASDDYDANEQGQSVYLRIQSMEGSARAASRLLHNAGIAGIKYLDGGSRKDGRGSFNYVVFDDSRIKTLAVEEEVEPFGRKVAEDGPSFADTININGVSRPTLNSEGRPIASTEQGIRAFWKWFGDSKVVDAQGRPLVVYHGGAAGTEAFDPAKSGTVQVSDWGKGIYFTPNKWQAQGYANDAALAIDQRDKDLYKAIDDTAAKYGVSDPMMAGIKLGIGSPEYAEVQRATNEWRQYRQEMRQAGGGEVYSTYLKIENPEVYQYVGVTDPYLADMAKANDRDGVVVVNEQVTGDLADHMDEILVFRPEQIKSVNNRGTFDPADPRIVREDVEPFGKGDPAPDIADRLVDKDGITRDIKAIKQVVGNPVDTLAKVMKSGFADNARALFYSADARLRYLAKRYNSDAITNLADQFHARAGNVDKAVTETYHEAVDREGYGRAGKVWRVLEPFAGDKAAMERIGLMLRNPSERTSAKRAEAEAARDIAKLLKDTIDYRQKAGEDIGEVSDGYFPRWIDVEKAMQQRGLFLRQATELYRRHGSENPQASAEAWLARLFDQYAGLDGGPDFIDLFHDTRQAGVGRKTAKPREFGKDADKLLGEFYNNDTGEVLTAYMIGAARKAEEARRFGGERMKVMMNRIKADIRKSGEDAGDALDTISRLVATNLGRTAALGERSRATIGVLQTASQLGTLDRATITSLSEAMMGFVRAGPRYGLGMVTDSAREFARQLRGASPSEAGRMAEALGIATDALVGEALASRAGFERAATGRRAAKVQQGFFRATGLHQWTEATRTATTKMGGKLLRDLSVEITGRKADRAAEYLRELGVKDPEGFAKWLREGGTPGVEQLTGASAGSMERQYRTALVRFANQTIMKPTRAQKPRWASHPVGSLFFSLMSFSYGFKTNVLDRTARMGKRAVKEGDPSLLYPAFGLAALFAVHTTIQAARQAILGGGREDDKEGIEFLDVLTAMDRAGLFAAASPLINAVFGLKYRRGIVESLIGPTVGRPADLITKALTLGTDANSPNTNTAERAAAGALYDVVLEPALEAYAVTRLKGALAAGVVWGSGNRQGGVAPPDRDWFIDAVAGPKKK